MHALKESILQKTLYYRKTNLHVSWAFFLFKNGKYYKKINGLRKNRHISNYKDELYQEKHFNRSKTSGLLYNAVQLYLTMEPVVLLQAPWFNQIPIGF